MLIFKKYLVIFLQRLKILSAVSMRLVQFTGKHRDRVHPKHLINQKPWYVKFLTKDDLVLDVGCANGQHTLKAAKYCKSIVGFDVANDQLKIAKKDAVKFKIKNIDFKCCSAEKKFPFRNNYFDKILLLDVIEHLNKRNFALREVHRVLKPGGLLLLAAPNKETSWKRTQASFGLPYFADPDHKIEYSKAAILTVIKKNMFSPVIIQPVVYDTPLAPLIDLVGGVSLSVYKRLLNWKKNYVKNHPTETTGFEIAAKKI